MLPAARLAEKLALDLAATRAVVPDAQDCKAWFAAKGAWANGVKFGEESSSWF